MATLNRLRCTWQGAGGLPGVSTFYLDPADASAVADVVAFFNAIKGHLPSSVSVSVGGSGDSIEDSTGALTGGWTQAGASVIQGTGGSGSYAAGTGYRVVWNTTDIVNGRRLKGSTFIAPAYGQIYGADGTIDATPLATAQTAATTLATAGALKVWHRPSPGGSNGTSGTVLSASVPDRVSSLRSRRY